MESATGPCSGSLAGRIRGRGRTLWDDAEDCELLEQLLAVKGTISTGKRPMELGILSGGVSKAEDRGSWRSVERPCVRWRGQREECRHWVFLSEFMGWAKKVFQQLIGDEGAFESVRRYHDTSSGLVEGSPGAQHVCGGVFVVCTQDLLRLQSCFTGSKRIVIEAQSLREPHYVVRAYTFSGGIEVQMAAATLT